METELSKAIDVLQKALKEDPGYFLVWQANIAVQFQDAFHAYHRMEGVHSISNRAATSFLELFINTGD